MSDQPLVYLGVCGKFHAFHLASQFARMERLGGLFAVDQRWSPPSDVPPGLFHNRRDLKWWRLLATRSPISLGHTFARESRLFDRWLSQKLSRLPGGIFHGWNTHVSRTLPSLDPSRWLRAVERSCPHNQFQFDLLAEEGERIGIPFEGDPRALESAIAELYAADIIVAPSQYSAGSYQDPILKRKVRVNPLGGNYAYRDRPAKSAPLRVLLVGNAFLRKGTHYLIEAFKRVDDPAAELWIRGEVPVEYRRRIQDSRVRIFPALTHGDLQKLYREATVFCLPSIDEGFGMVGLEALSYGLPVIYTDHCGVGDILCAEMGGRVAIRSPEAIVAAIEAVRQWTSSDYERFDVERKKILQRATWENCALRMLNEVYRR